MKYALYILAGIAIGASVSGYVIGKQQTTS